MESNSVGNSLFTVISNTGAALITDYCLRYSVNLRAALIQERCYFTVTRY